MKYERITNGLFHEEVDDIAVYRRLKELENKIENGTLIELPRMFQDLSKLGWYVEWLDETGCAIHCHFCDKNRAEAKLKELQQ